MAAIQSTWLPGKQVIKRPLLGIRIWGSQLMKGCGERGLVLKGCTFFNVRTRKRDGHSLWAVRACRKQHSPLIMGLKKREDIIFFWLFLGSSLWLQTGMCSYASQCIIIALMQHYCIVARSHLFCNIPILLLSQCVDYQAHEKQSKNTPSRVNAIRLQTNKRPKRPSGKHFSQPSVKLSAIKLFFSNPLIPAFLQVYILIHQSGTEPRVNVCG